MSAAKKLAPVNTIDDPIVKCQREEDLLIAGTNNPLYHIDYDLYFELIKNSQRPKLAMMVKNTLETIPIM